MAADRRPVLVFAFDVEVFVVPVLLDCFEDALVDGVAGLLAEARQRLDHAAEDGETDAQGVDAGVGLGQFLADPLDVKPVKRVSHAVESMRGDRVPRGVF